MKLLCTLMFAPLCFLSFSPARAEDQWFCKEGASRALGDVMESCGIGKSKDESEARKKALDGAFDEFDRICRESVNCRDYEKTVEPMRTECLKDKKEVFTCYRALDFTVTKQKKEKAFDDQDKKDAIVAEINKNGDTQTGTDGANPALADTSTPAPNIYRNVTYRNSNPYIYVISSQPRIVYVRSELPPQYVPAPQPAPLPAQHMRNQSHHGKHSKYPRTPHVKKHET